MYNNNALIKSFLATAATAQHTIVKFGANDDTIANSTAATDALLGVINEIGATADDVANGATVDIILCGIAEIKLGGTVARGGKITSGAAGVGVAGVAGNQGIGKAMRSGVAGDIIPVLLNQSTI